MTQIRVENPIETRFAMVPNALWALEIPFDAKGLFAYLLSYRHGGAPTVKQIEAETGMGRDRRRKAMTALIDIGAAWYENITKGGVIVGKVLVISTAFLDRAPENQSLGENHRAPEIPAVGKSTPTGVEIHPSRDGISGDILKERKKQAAALARAAVKKKDKGSADPMKSEDRDVRAAAKAYADPMATKDEKRKIKAWLSGKGYAVASSFV